MIGCNHTSLEWIRAYGIIRHMQGLYNLVGVVSRLHNIKNKHQIGLALLVYSPIKCQLYTFPLPLKNLPHPSSSSLYMPSAQISRALGLTHIIHSAFKCQLQAFPLCLNHLPPLLPLPLFVKGTDLQSFRVNPSGQHCHQKSIEIKFRFLVCYFNYQMMVM